MNFVSSCFLVTPRVLKWESSLKRYGIYLRELTWLPKIAIFESRYILKPIIFGSTMLVFEGGAGWERVPDADAWILLMLLVGSIRY